MDAVAGFQSGAMTLYDLLLFVHVLAAAAWVGAVIFFALVLELALRSDDRSLLLRLIAYDDRLAPIFYIPAVVVVLAAGIGLVIEGPWSFSDGWVLAGLALLLSALALGLVFFLPTARRLRAAVDASGVESDAASVQLRTYRTLTWIDAAILVAAVFVMTAKPF
jgi:uncharacterized membrane protein